MERIWTKHKKINPVRSKAPLVSADAQAHRTSNGVNTTLKPKVFVAVSGGVDSSVALALLKRGGYDVTGCFMKNWSRKYPGLDCNWVGEREDAMRVCAYLGVPFREVNLEKEYAARVFKNFIAEYRVGCTPNPDVLCNSEIKFGAFLRWALQKGADAIATGHYARIAEQRTGNIEQGENPDDELQVTSYKLQVAMDTNKDQSYFLYRLGQKELARILFPVGFLKKPQVRAIARRLGLPTAEKKDSQGVCFMGEVALREFLRGWIPERRGKIILLPSMENIRTSVTCYSLPARPERSRRVTRYPVVGEHRGAWYYTIGQRRGVGVGGGGTPLYVAAKDIKRNTLFVATKNHPALYAKTLVLKNVHWVSGSVPKLPLHCRVRIRYRQPLQLCRITRFKIQDLRFKIRVAFRDPQWAPAPGQSVVFYHGAEVLGGGVIDRTASP